MKMAETSLKMVPKLYSNKERRDVKHHIKNLYSSSFGRDFEKYTMYKKKRTKIKKMGLTFDFKKNDLDLIKKSKETFLLAFLPTDKQLEAGNDNKQEMLKKEWNETIINVTSLLKDGGKIYIHSIKDGQDVIAFALFYVSTDETEIFVDILAVNPNYQRMSLGSTLLDSLFFEFPENSLIELITNRKDNEKALKFYKKNGFVTRFELSHNLVLVKKRW